MITLENIQREIAQIKEKSWGYGPREMRLNEEAARALTLEHGDLSAILGLRLVIADIKSVVLVDIAGAIHKVES